MVLSKYSIFNIVIAILDYSPLLIVNLSLNLLCFIFSIISLIFFLFSIYYYRSSNCRNSDSCSSLALKGDAISFPLLFAIAFKIENELQLSLLRQLKEQKQISLLYNWYNFLASLFFPFLQILLFQLSRKRQLSLFLAIIGR